jgi:hypothetical protein
MQNKNTKEKKKHYSIENPHNSFVFYMRNVYSNEMYFAKNVYCITF